MSKTAKLGFFLILLAIAGLTALVFITSLGVM